MFQSYAQKMYEQKETDIFLPSRVLKHMPGRTRFFIIPNILQFDGCYIVVDPSGELEQKLGGGLEANGYIIKRFSTDDMTKSNRFNPLFYIRKTSDILIVVNTLIENTQEGSGKTSGVNFFSRM